MTASASVQEYLQALHNLTGGNTDLVVSTTELAAQMSVTAPSVTEMLRRLDQLGLVSYSPYQGASLTAHGATEGARVVRYHRLWERMLVDVLAMSWDEVHEEACRLEHATSPRVAEALSRFLDHPATCPHGHAVPVETSPGATHAAPELDSPREPADPPMLLRDAPEGFRGRVASVAEQPDLLKYCSSTGLVPGATVRVVRVHPLDELTEVLVGPVPEAAAGSEAGGRSAVGGGGRSLTVGARVGRLVRVTAGRQGLSRG